MLGILEVEKWRDDQDHEGDQSQEGEQEHEGDLSLVLEGDGEEEEEGHLVRRNVEGEANGEVLEEGEVREEDARERDDK